MVYRATSAPISAWSLPRNALPHAQA